jgi:2,5-furandicarboxylate decarboxylase 1
MAKDMRTFLRSLEEAKEVAHVAEEIDVDGEMARRLFTSREKALFFENVKDFPGWKVLGQAPANMRHIGLALGVEPKQVVREMATRVENGLIPCQMVESGPVKDVILRGQDADLTKIPAHVAGEKDPGRFIAGGLCIVKDPETGRRNMAFHRLQVKGPRKMGMYMVEGRHTWLIYQKYEAMNKPMPMSVCIGHHPMMYFAAGYSGALGMDELEAAGAFLGEAIELTKCETIDLEAPSRSEIVLECEVPPGLRETEGPFSEFTGYYGGGEERPFVNLKAITMRKDAIYKAVQSSGHTESIFYNGLPQAVALFRDLRHVGNYVDLKDVSCNWGGTYTVVVQMTPRFFGEAKHVLLAALSSYYLHQKVAVAVDDDVDIYDPQDIAWSIATRVNPETDVSIISDVRGHPMDLSLPEIRRPGFPIPQRNGSKMLIDATKPPTCDPQARALFERVRPPAK